MFDGLAGLRIAHQQRTRVVVSLQRSTHWFGLSILILAGVLGYAARPLGRLEIVLILGIAALGVALLTLRRELIFDREDGVLHIREQVLGLHRQLVVPLFHLRAVVIVARKEPDRWAPLRSRYIAYVDRRMGKAIYLDEATHCAQLLRLAEVISEVAELNLEYDATSRTATSRFRS